MFLGNVIEEKSFNFAVRVIKLYKHISQRQNDYILSKQILRSGTSIGANISEAQQAQSKADFISKMSIALKETTETKYWLKLLKETDYITESEFNSIFGDCAELERILVSIIKTSKKQIACF
ncbi:MAG: hypothetical protein BWY15_00313 [Firmicutes bacterium ADurb.Bin193]|nr:MAG: hypothetical protein BWY15_00313 [Firmicutes bacterium ADurb.Bin193]